MRGVKILAFGNHVVFPVSYTISGTLRIEDLFDVMTASRAFRFSGESSVSCLRIVSNCESGELSVGWGKKLAAEGFDPMAKGFGGFCSGLRVKLASKLVKSP